MHGARRTARDLAALAIATAGPCVIQLAACCPSKVSSFSVQPPMVCPGQSATVQWDVRGRASLRAERAPNDWDEGEVPSTGSRIVMPSGSTTFTVKALDANPADGASFGTKPLQVPQGAEDRGNNASCDSATRKCTATFSLEDGSGLLKVQSLSAPTVIQGGVSKAAAITVTHGAWHEVVPAGGTTPAGVAASGAWTLEIDLSPADPLAPPPQLRVRVDFGCH
jgi:hypothetical protein